MIFWGEGMHRRQSGYSGKVTKDKERQMPPPPERSPAILYKFLNANFNGAQNSCFL